MWLFCEDGYFSAVAHMDKPGVILLRARFKGDLERLFKRHAALFQDGKPPKAIHTPDADYAYRSELPKETWAAIVSEEALAIDYCNFKSHVHEGSPRDTAYMGCWSSLRNAQERMN